MKNKIITALSSIVIVIIAFILFTKSSNQDVSQDQSTATTTQETTGNTVTLEDNKLPPESLDQIVKVEAPSKTPTITGIQVKQSKSASSTLRLLDTKMIGNVTITVKKVEDDRCPIDMSCDEPGDVRVLLGVVGPETTKNVSLTEGQGFYVDDILVALTDVLPERRKNRTIFDKEYRFVITANWKE